MKRLSHFLLFPNSGQFLAPFRAFLPNATLPTVGLLAFVGAASWLNQPGQGAEILNPNTTGPYGAGYPYGYYSELPPNPPDLNKTTGTSPETPSADSGRSNLEPGQDAPPPMPETNPENKAEQNSSEEKSAAEEKSTAEKASAKKKAPEGKTGKEEKAKEEKPKGEESENSEKKKGGLLEEFAAAKKEQETPSRPENLPESPARTVLKEMQAGHYAKALVDLDNLKRLNPQAYELDYLSAINHIMLKQPAQARAYYKKILQSQAPEALKQLARTGLQKMGSTSQH